MRIEWNRSHRSISLAITFCFPLVGHCVIQVLPEISCKGLTKEDIPQLVTQVQGIMQDEFDVLNREMVLKTMETTAEHKKID